MVVVVVEKDGKERRWLCLLFFFLHLLRRGDEETDRRRRSVVGRRPKRENEITVVSLFVVQKSSTYVRTCRAFTHTLVPVVILASRRRPAVRDPNALFCIASSPPRERGKTQKREEKRECF